MRQRHIYAAIREAHEETGYPIELACELLHVARSAYHRWASGKLSRRAAENEHLADTIEKIHEESPASSPHCKPFIRHFSRIFMTSRESSAR